MEANATAFSHAHVLPSIPKKRDTPDLTCEVCGFRVVKLPNRHARRTCSTACQKQLLSMNPNLRRNNSVIGDGPGPNDPTPEQIRQRAQLIKEQNMDAKRRGVILRGRD